MQPQAREKAEEEGFEVGVVKTNFKVNTKALAENEGDGLAKVIHCCVSTLLHSEYIQQRIALDANTTLMLRSLWVM